MPPTYTSEPAVAARTQAPRPASCSSLDPQASSLARPPPIRRCGPKPKSEHIRLLPSPAGMTSSHHQASRSPQVLLLWHAAPAGLAHLIPRGRAQCLAHLCAQGTAQGPISGARKYSHRANPPASRMCFFMCKRGLKIPAPQGFKIQRGSNSGMWSVPCKGQHRDEE